MSFFRNLKKKDIGYLVRELALARSIEGEYKKEAGSIKVKIDTLIEERYGKIRASLEKSLEVAQADVKDLEDQVRREGLEQFEKTGVKKVHAAVLVKTYQTMKYDGGTALEYAREHIPSAIKLDKRAFSKVAKVLDLDFVEIGEENRATISRDLSEYVKKNGG